MRMLPTRKHMQLLVHATSERTLGQHALDSKLDRALRVLGQQLLQPNRLQVTDITCVVVILLLRQLVAGDADLLGIDHNDVIAGVDVWTVNSLVFATQPHRDLGRKPTQHLVGCVDHKPIAAHLARLRKYCSHLLKLRPSPRAADLRQVGHRKKGRNLTQALAPLQNQYCRGSGSGPLAYNLPMSPSENAGRPPLGPLDNLLAAAGRGLKTILAPPAATRPLPAGAASATSTAVPLQDVERRLAADLMRVNHAGEIAAQALYHAQSLTARDPKFVVEGNASRLAWLRRCEAGHKIEIACLGLGQARILHLPGESFVEYQLAAKALRPESFVAVAAYGDYAPWYIGTAIAC